MYIKLRAQYNTVNFSDKVLKTMFVNPPSWQIKHVAVKPILVIQLTNVIVKCKVIVFAVMIALVGAMCVKNK